MSEQNIDPAISLPRAKENTRSTATAKDTHSVSKRYCEDCGAGVNVLTNLKEYNQLCYWEVVNECLRGVPQFKLQQELRTLLMSGDPGVSAFPDGDNLFRWVATLIGAKGTAYEGLSYKLSLEFPSGYPYQAPTVKFETPCWHPNVDQSGNICLDILKEKWSALYDVRTILLSLQSLLGEPNNESPLNAQAAEQWNNQTEYKKIVVDKYNKHSASANK